MLQSKTIFFKNFLAKIIFSTGMDFINLKTINSCKKASSNMK